MFAPVRAGLFAALLAFACVQSGLLVSAPPALAQAKAEKPFQREDLDEAAVRLEGQIKTDAGQVQKPAAQLRRESDEAFKKNDFNLNIPRYVDTFEEEEEIDVKAVQRVLDVLEDEWDKLKVEMRRYMEKLA